MTIFKSAVSLIVLFSSTAISEEKPKSIEGYPAHLLYSQTIGELSNPEVRFQHIDPSRTWQQGQELKICFFGGDAVVHELVTRVASEWQSYINLTFNFGTEGNRRDCTKSNLGFSHIRISFSEPGYWSLVGTDSTRLANQHQSSMNLEWFDLSYNSLNGHTVGTVVINATDEDKGTILHEFGHAIGLLHEHANPNINCWNKIHKTGSNNVYDYYWKHYGWNEGKVRRNIGLASQTDPLSVGGEIDVVDSIMAYQLPVEVLINGENSECYVKELKHTISDLDKKWVNQYYPTGIPIPTLSEDSINPLDTLMDYQPSEDPLAIDDYISRIRADLNSDDQFTRRDARTRLSQYIDNSGSSDVVDSLSKQLLSQSYRDTLGFAAALANTRTQVTISPITKSRLESVLKNSDEQILIGNIEKSLEANIIQ